MLSEDATTDRCAPPTQIAISRGGVETSWTSAETIAPLVIAVLVFAAFAYWEAKKAILPILPLRLFTCPTVSGSHIATFTSMAGQFIVLFYVPNFLQIVRGLSIVSDSLIPPGWSCR
jgi:predicted MFS family arabinose efflux permease